MPSPSHLAAPAPTFLCTTLSLTRLSLILQIFPVPSGSPAPVPSTSSKGPPSSLLGWKSGSPWSFPALLPLWSFRIPPQGGVACFSVPLNFFINPLLHFAVGVHRTKNPVPAGIAPVEDVAFSTSSGWAWANLLNEDSWLPASFSTPAILLGDSCQHPVLQFLDLLISNNHPSHAASATPSLPTPNVHHP